MKTIALMPVLLIVIGFVIILWSNRGRSPRQVVRAMVTGLLSINGLIFVIAMGMMVFSLGNPIAVLAQSPTAVPTATAAPDTALGAALATGLACIGAGIGVGIAGAAAIGGITEKPEILGRTIIFVGLAEGVAIYGLIISLMILNR